MNGQELHRYDEIIKKSILIVDENPVEDGNPGNPLRYHLPKSTDNLDQSEPYRKITFGKRNKDKPHKTMLMVGETGTGKTKLINTIVNYILDVKREDKIWFEITDERSEQTSTQSQTSSITVYGFYLQESPIDLTIIDTPGYGDMYGTDIDEKNGASLLSLTKSDEDIHEIHAVCLVIMAHQNRLSDRQMYIFDAVQSLFGKDIAENIVLLFTHSTGAQPKNVLTAVKEAKIKCAVNDKNQPVYFLFDNCQSDAADEEYEKILKQSWDLSFNGMEGLFKFLKTIQPKTFQMTHAVSLKFKQLKENVSNLNSKVEEMNKMQNNLQLAQEALEKSKKYAIENNNFEYEDEVTYKVKVDIDSSVAKEVLCCTSCEENCHCPSFWSKFLPGVIKNDCCTVCTNKCHYSKHVKEAKMYITKTRTEKRTYEDLKKKHEENIKNCVSSVKELEENIQKLQIDKVKLVMEAFHCVETLEMMAPNINSLITLQNIDFLIKKLEEFNEPEKAKTLENIKKRAGKEKN